MKAGIKALENKILSKLDSMLDQVGKTRAFLERVVYPTYLRAQMKRWMSEGRTDGYGSLDPWKPLSARYKAWKLTRWASAPGGGTKTLIASGRLYAAVMNKGPGHRKLVSDRSIIIGVDVPYAKYVNADRPFFIFSDEMMVGLKDKYAKFVNKRQEIVE